MKECMEHFEKMEVRCPDCGLKMEKITKKKLYELIDESLEGIEDYECCKHSRESQCKEIKKMIKKL